MAEANAASIRKKILIGTSTGREEKQLVGWLHDAGYVSGVCSDPDEILHRSAGEDPDLVILHMSHEGLSESHFLERFDEDERSSRVPVLVLLANGDAPQNASRTGGRQVDFLSEPYGSTQLLSRVRAMLRVASDDSQLGGLSERDGLTKLYNRRYLDERIEKELERARRYARCLSCVMVDIDHFQRINAMHGYKAGDEILKALADILLAQSRLPDIVARFGSEEFVLILPETSGAEAAILSERLRTVFEDRIFTTGYENIRATVSCGVATYPDHASDVGTLLRMADSAVYQAKQEGRNRTAVAFANREGGMWESGPPATILLVEDNDYSRTVASLVLRASGYEVIEASDGATAIDLARTAHPDLVIIDVNLHGMSGLEATRQLVEMEETKDIPVIALTTKDMPGDLEALVKAGCRGYITKPIDTNNLASQIESYLQG